VLCVCREKRLPVTDRTKPAMPWHTKKAGLLKVHSSRNLRRYFTPRPFPSPVFGNLQYANTTGDGRPGSEDRRNVDEQQPMRWVDVY